MKFVGGKSSIFAEIHKFHMTATIFSKFFMSILHIWKFQTDQNFYFNPLDKDLDSELFQIFCIAPTNVGNIRNIGMLKSWPILVQHKICSKTVDNEDIEIFVIGGE